MMSKKPKVASPQVAPAETKPPKFEDFLKPNPFIRPWMMKFLSENRRFQDVVIVGVGCVLFFLLGVLFYELGAGEIISAGVGLAGLAILTGESEARYIIAGAKFGQAKKQAQLLRTNKQ